MQFIVRIIDVIGYAKKYIIEQFVPFIMHGCHIVFYALRHSLYRVKSDRT